MSNLSNKTYKSLFFDLDRTLWDFETNSLESFHDIVDHFNLNGNIPSFDVFYSTYRKFNDELWRMYREKQISKEKLAWTRFYRTINFFGIDNETMAREMGAFYLKASKSKTHIFPHTHEILEYLSPKYSLFVITNGFEEVQEEKMKNCKLDSYFEKIITSEAAGVQKPNPLIFEYALNQTNSKVESSLMIGDDMEVDIKGARNVNMDTVHFNYVNWSHEDKADYEIFDLIELKEIL